MDYVTSSLARLSICETVESHDRGVIVLYVGLGIIIAITVRSHLKAAHP